eukprot:1160256-Pelagomonas_calceolata.AAC.25
MHATATHHSRHAAVFQSHIAVIPPNACNSHPPFSHPAGGQSNKATHRSCHAAMVLSHLAEREPNVCHSHPPLMPCFSVSHPAGGHLARRFTPGSHPARAELWGQQLRDALL